MDRLVKNAAMKNTDTSDSINKFQIEKTSNKLMPLQRTPNSTRDTKYPLMKLVMKVVREIPRWTKRVRFVQDSSILNRTGFLESKQDDKTTAKARPNEGCFQTKTDDKINKSLNTSDRTCRRTCPRCSLETIVRRKQFSKRPSGLHVICCRCKLDWCFTCESLWHPGDACIKFSYNSSARESKKELPGPKILGDSIDSDECNEMRTVYETFNYEELKEIPKSHFKESSTKISNKDRPIPSFCAKYINKVEDEPSVILNIGNTCDICFCNSTDDIRECCQIRVCGDCISTYLTLKISSGVADITCPNHGCNHIITEAEIRTSVDVKTFLKYLQCIVNAKYQQYIVKAKRNPYRKTCPRCSYVTVIDASNGSYEGLRISCPECELCWCFNCQVPWHRNMTCRQYRSGDDEIFKKWALSHSSGQINAQKCPGCQVYIQRKSGCNQMKCTHCGTKFCYQCGKRGFSHEHYETRSNNCDNRARNDYNAERNFQTHPERRRNRLDGVITVCIYMLVVIVAAFVSLLPYIIVLATSGRNDATSYSNSTSSPPYLHSNFSAL